MLHKERQKHTDKCNEDIAEFIKCNDKSTYVTKSQVLTFNVNYDSENVLPLFEKCKVIAQLGVRYQYNSSKKVSHIGVPSAIANAVLRKYGKNNTTKEVSNVVIPINNQTLRWDGHTITIPPLKLEFEFDSERYPNVTKVNHIELSENGIAHVQCEVVTANLQGFSTYMGIDRNSTSFVCVAANLDTGKVFKLGKEVSHTHKKYSALRRHAVREGQTKKHHKNRHAHQIANRERNINNDSLHKIANEVVEQAKSDNAVIVLEDLVGIKGKAEKPKKSNNYKCSVHSKATRDNLNSWSQYKLGEILKYKAHLLGVPVIYINPVFTSQKCSRCDTLVGRDKKHFKCDNCGHVDHADVNAAFNIARSGRSYVDRVTYEGEH